jgi:hypothetical protein
MNHSLFVLQNLERGTQVHVERLETTTKKKKKKESGALGPLRRHKFAELAMTQGGPMLQHTQ